MGNTLQAPNASEKNWLGEDIVKRVMGVCMEKFNVTFLIMIHEEVEANMDTVLDRSMAFCLHP